MPEYNWPAQGTTALVGKSHDRIDGLQKATGMAKYAYDINLPKMVFAHLFTCPLGHAKLASLDVSAAEKVPGVVKVKTAKNTKVSNVLRAVGAEIHWAGDLVACVVAESNEAAAEGVKAIKANFEKLDIFVDDDDLEAAVKAGRVDARRVSTNIQVENEQDDEAGDNAEIERLLKAAEVKVEGDYGIHMITHCCLEPHGGTSTWEGDKLTVYLSTQNVSGTGGGFADAMKIGANQVAVECQYIGGGFGSKFRPGSEGVLGAEIAKELGRPVKLLLDRRTELEIAGNRPSGFLHARVGADKTGKITVWDSHHWGTNGALRPSSVSLGQIPYVFNPKNRRRKMSPIACNVGPVAAWRAPNHPQACAITHTVIDDIAAKLGVDSRKVFEANLPSAGDKAPVYAEQLKIASELIEWDKKWHAHGKGKKNGSVVTGLGMAMHTWGGGAGNSKATVKVNPDGSVEVFCGTQDLGTGTRTVINLVVAETFGLPLSAVAVNVGSSSYPASGASGGSTTVGGVSESSRRASQQALWKINDLVAKKLNVQADQLVASNGWIHVKGDSDKGLTWKQAAALLGMQSLEETGDFKRGSKSPLSSSQVAGVQMAEVAVDTETGVVKMVKFVAVQDMGLIVSRKQAESQIYGAAIMGIAFGLFEEQIMDPATGRFVNAELADYKLPRIGDIGDIVVHLYEPASEYQRGVVGLGEPPVIAPGAAISNAVANAIGARVKTLPLTPARVLEALKQA